MREFPLHSHTHRPCPRRYTKDRPRFQDVLEIIKFICKEFWSEVYKKQIDNLRTNHRVIFHPYHVLSSSSLILSFISLLPFFLALSLSPSLLLFHSIPSYSVPPLFVFFPSSLLTPSFHISLSLPLPLIRTIFTLQGSFCIARLKVSLADKVVQLLCLRDQTSCYKISRYGWYKYKYFYMINCMIYQRASKISPFVDISLTYEHRSTAKQAATIYLRWMHLCIYTLK